MSNQSKEVVLIGYSGHGKVVAEATFLCNLRISGYVDVEKKSDDPYRLNYLGADHRISDLIKSGNSQFILGIGDNRIRPKLAELVTSLGGRCLTIIHPEANVSKQTNIAEGTFVARGARINPFVKIGRYCIINTTASIDHDCLLEDGVHIAPGAVIAGNVEIGKECFVGANAVVRNNLRIDDNALIGAGSVVVKDVAKNSTMVGNPASRLR